jgi:hypothetical protein
LLARIAHEMAIIGRDIVRMTHVRALLATWRGRFIVVFVLAQLVLPLHYYIRHRDPHDERFAWRMFSPMRMAQCTPKVVLDGKPFDLRTEFHEAWLEIAARGRFSVVEQMGEHLCAQHPGSVITVSLDCTYIDRPAYSWGGYDICNVPQL